MKSIALTRKTLAVFFAAVLTFGLCPSLPAQAQSPSQPSNADQSQTEGTFFSAYEGAGTTFTSQDSTADISRTNPARSFAFNSANLNPSVSIDDGLYMLQVSGAAGGTSTGKGTGKGGNGGSSTAVTPLNATTLYVYPGGKGGDTKDQAAGSAGANGGGAGGVGKAKWKCGGSGGGGATHIGTAAGTLKTLRADDSQILIVAGGGGGSTRGDFGARSGAGGGTSGTAGTLWNGKACSNSNGGTQTSGYAAGEGQKGRNYSNAKYAGEGNGGGGGGYWGGWSYQSNKDNSDASGGGGSGFLNDAFIQGTKASGGGSISCTIDGSTQTVATTTTNTNSGAGTANITYLASIVTLDNQGGATTGTQTLYAAPNSDSYYTSYSVAGLGSAVQKITIPTKETPFTYFDGYYTQPNHGGTRYIAPDGTVEAGLYTQGTTTLYAAWGIQVKFNDNGTETTGMPETQTIEKGTKATQPSDPISTSGMTFKGWSIKKDSYEPIDFSTYEFQEDTTLYTFWTPYVEFDMRGHGDQVPAQFIPYSGAAKPPTKPTATGYTFECWCSDEELEHEFDFDTPITTDTVLYAKWSANRYAVDFYEEGELKGSQDFVYDEPFTPLLTAESMGVSREDWTFAGWRDSEALQVDFTDGQEVQNLSTETGRIALNAVWARDITFISGVEQAPAEESNALQTQASTNSADTVEVEQLSGDGEYGTITAPTLSTLEGWNPVGWLSSTVAASSADASSGAAFVPQATTFYGLYNRDVSLIFDGNEADGGYVEPLSDVQRLNASGDLTQMTFVLPANEFTREGWAFTWWDLGAPGQALTLKPAIDEPSEIIVRAHWEALDSSDTSVRPANNTQLANTADTLPFFATGIVCMAALALLLLLIARRRATAVGIPLKNGGIHEPRHVKK